MGNVAIYCRVSTGLQNTDRQRTELLALAKKIGEDINESNVYEDIISGFSQGDDRPEYSRLMQDVESGIIKEIWFHEMTRMARNSIELLSEIKRLSNIGIKLFFLKQNLMVDPDNPSDIGQKILLSVLAVTAEYEIELFMERSLSGKIRKIQQGYGITADSHSYGYMVDDNKKMIIKESEAVIIQRIFTMYADGFSTLKIADILNSEGITKNGIKWRAGMVTKVLNKDLYLGHRHVVFHKPVVNKETKNKMKEKGEHREIVYTFDVPQEDLRIIDDVLSQRVKDRLKQAPYNKDNATKHDTLLIKKLRCGECGSNFTVGKNNEDRTYRCYGRIKRSDKAATCDRGAEVKQIRLDGLVFELSFSKFALKKFKTNTQETLKEIENQTIRIQNIIKSKNKELSEVNESYKTTLRRLIRFADDSTVEELINESKNNHDKQTMTISREIQKYTSQLSELTTKAETLKKINNNGSIFDMHLSIKMDKSNMKIMVDELIEVIEIFKMNHLWNLVIIKYIDGSEYWGKVKNARYKKKETVGIFGYKTWRIDNTNQNFSYNKDTHTITYDGKSSEYKNIRAGEYDYATLNEMIGFAVFRGYDYEKGSFITKRKLIKRGNSD